MPHMPGDPHFADFNAVQPSFLPVCWFFSLRVVSFVVAHFPRDCIHHHLERKSFCPICKQAISKRGLNASETLEAIILKAAELAEAVQADSKGQVISPLAGRVPQAAEHQAKKLKPRALEPIEPVPPLSRRASSRGTTVPTPAVSKLPSIQSAGSERLGTFMTDASNRDLFARYSSTEHDDDTGAGSPASLFASSPPPPQSPPIRASQLPSHSEVQEHDDDDLLPVEIGPSIASLIHLETTDKKRLSADFKQLKFVEPSQSLGAVPSIAAEGAKESVASTVPVSLPSIPEVVGASLEATIEVRQILEFSRVIVCNFSSQAQAGSCQWDKCSQFQSKNLAQPSLLGQKFSVNPREMQITNLVKNHSHATIPRLHSRLF